MGCQVVEHSQHLWRLLRLLYSANFKTAGWTIKSLEGDNSAKISTKREAKQEVEVSSPRDDVLHKTDRRCLRIIKTKDFPNRFSSFTDYLIQVEAFLRMWISLDQYQLFTIFWSFHESCIKSRFTVHKNSHLSLVINSPDAESLWKIKNDGRTYIFF